MLSLSVNKWGFTDKLFENTTCPEEGGFSRIKSHSVRQRLSGIAVWDRVSMKNIGLRGFNKSSSDDRPGPGICGSKYVEDAKAARSVRVWDRVPMKNMGI